MVHKKWFRNPDEHYLGEILYVTSGSKLPSRIAFRLFHLYWFNAQKEIPCSFHLDLMSRTFHVLHIPGQNSSKLTTTHTLLHILALLNSWIKINFNKLNRNCIWMIKGQNVQFSEYAISRHWYLISCAIKV